MANLPLAAASDKWMLGKIATAKNLALLHAANILAKNKPFLLPL